MKARHLLTLADIEDADLRSMVDYSTTIAQKGFDQDRPLAGRAVGIYFRKTSTRTRTSYTIGAQRLGASFIAYGPNDLQLLTGETPKDTARVLSEFLDALVVRTNESMDELRDFAVQARMSIVNAMSATEHPSQAITDLSALREHFGRLEGLHMLYLGEGNNTTSALAWAFARSPNMRLTIVTPPGEGLPSQLLADIDAVAAIRGSRIEQHHDISVLPSEVDVVYTTRWTTMGAPKANPNWRELYAPYSVTTSLMQRVSKSHTIFMHDLPAMRGEEVTDEVLDGARSIAYRQAFHKLTGAMAVLRWCVPS